MDGACSGRREACSGNWQEGPGSPVRARLLWELPGKAGIGVIVGEVGKRRQDWSRQLWRVQRDFRLF